MATAVTMPQMGYDMTEGAVQTWLKKEGDRIEKGEIIAEIETDKASVELEAFASGVLRKIMIETGKVVPINTTIAVIGEAEEAIDWASFGATAPIGQAATPTATTIPVPSDQLQGVAATTPTPPISPNPEMPVPATQPVAKEQPAPISIGQPQGIAPTTQYSQPVASVNNGAVAVASPAIGGRVLSSPLARKVAGELGIDIAKISGTGPAGRVKKADVEQYYARAGTAATTPAPVFAPQTVSIPQPTPTPAPVAAPDTRYLTPDTRYEEKDLSRMRQTIARRMTESKQQVPHFYITNEVDMGEAMKLRQTINAALEKEGGQKVSVNDLVIKAVAKALKKYPTINSSFQGAKLRLNQDINIAFAVALEDGLITPVIRNADQKSISQIASEARTLAEKARKGTIRPDDFSGGTFTISNLGMYDVSHFVAIINQPQAAILAVSAIKPTVVVQGGNAEDGYQFGVIQQMAVTVSVDHRATDGAVGAQFLQELKSILQNPFSLLL